MENKELIKKLKKRTRRSQRKATQIRPFHH